jgi:hypothetical protein
MKVSERALILAVRDALRVAFETTVQNASDRIQAEIDEEVPATSGHEYIIVMPGGFGRSRRHLSSGGVFDLTYGVDVMVAKRVTNVPRDRRRDSWLYAADSLTPLVDLVIETVDFAYSITTAANATILEESSEDSGFIHPLVFASVDPRPRVVGPEVFLGQSQGVVGVARNVRFSDARRITSRS